MRPRRSRLSYRLSSSAMGTLHQFKLLLWKNCRLQRRQVKQTVVEVLLPAVFALILVIIRQTVDNTTYSRTTQWGAFSTEELPATLLPPKANPFLPQPKWKVPYSPHNITAVANIMDKLRSKLDFNLTGFTDESTMLEYLTSEEVTNDVWGGIVFTCDFPGGQLPAKITYKIRIRSEQRRGLNKPMSGSQANDWPTQLHFPVFQLPGPRSPSRADGGKPFYYEEGFLGVQRAIDEAILLELNSTVNPGHVTPLLQRFPYPPYVDDVFILVLQKQFPFIILLSFLVVAPTIVKDIAVEKERRLKEYMKMMGLSNWLHWTAWFIKYLIVLLVVVLLMVFLFCFKFGDAAVVSNTDPSVLLVFLLLYSISTICFSFMVSTVFSKASTASSGSGFLFFMNYLPYMFMQSSIGDLSLMTRLSTCVLHNTAMALGCVQISLYEGTGEGVQWSNIALPVSLDDSFTMAHVFISFVVDSALYLLITWYIDAIHPGDYGIPKPWYFPVQRSYWCGNTSKEELDEEMELSVVAQGEFFEKPPSNNTAGIRILHLRKEFKTGGAKKVAVWDTNLDIYEGQVTALLGHNGAGKTTTMSILTGFLPPTSGTAIVNGYDIRKNIEKVRSSLGLCPQHDVLFDDLTVEEHLRFFSQLKGVPPSEVKGEVTKMIQLLHLEDKRKTLSKNLSGGMKRKVSVGISLIGGSKVVILDEPTSGMDPEARRQMWDIIQNQREGRTVILSTHFMDEADLLGDHIAIMAEGVVKCYGSSMFLKRKFGVGYHMGMVKEQTCDVAAVIKLVNKFVPTATVESNISAELAFILPQESSAAFEELFTELENMKEKLGIASFGASVTTLEEVFLKVGESMDDSVEERLHEGIASPPTIQKSTAEHNASIAPGSVSQNQTASGEIKPEGKSLKQTASMEERCQLKPVFGVEVRKHTGVALYCRQFQAMFIKRVIHTWRNRLVTQIQLFVPLVFAIMGGTILETFPAAQDPPALTLDIAAFSTPASPQSVPYAVSVDSAEVNVSGVNALSQAFTQYLSPKVTSTVLINDLPNWGSSPDVRQYIGDLGKSSIGEYNRNYMLAGQIHGLLGAGNLSDSANFTVLFNNQAFHTVAIAASTIGNTMLQWAGLESYSIEATNHPLPYSADSKLEQELMLSSIASFIMTYNVMFGVAFLVGTFVVFLIKERSQKSKHIQFVSGVHAVNFWFSTFTWDFINFMIPSLLLLVVFAAFGIEALTSNNNLGVVFLVLILYAWAVLPITYLLSFLFTVPASGCVWTTVINYFTGNIPLLVITILRLLWMKDTSDTLTSVFYVFLPNFCFGSAIQDIFSNYNNKKICTSTGIDLDVLCPIIGSMNGSNPCCPDYCYDYCTTYTDSYLSWTYPGLGQPLFFMAVQGVVCFLIIFILESGFMKRVGQAITEAASTAHDLPEEVVAVEKAALVSKSSHTGLAPDNDIVQERNRIHNTSTSQLTDTLVLSDVRKMYGNFLAVNKITVGIPQGECFGLLGVNGAGKTTTFKMLTGDINMTSGDAILDGFHVNKNIKQVQQRLGYCPQFDALIEQMTVRETLFMYARLRGVYEDQITELVDNLVNSLLLKEHVEKQAGTLSGGNKRKLSTAMALIGDPPVILLDEPTTGMDPLARRLLWDTLTKVRKSGRTLVLTSHSMEECEALCTRLVIMVNGEFKCLGGPQHLKNKFGEGYTVLIKVEGVDDEQIAERLQRVVVFIENKFPLSILKDIHQGYVHYQIKAPNLSWAKVFGTMERAKKEYFIEDYSVSQTTLEQIFISFARSQKPPREEKIPFIRKLRSFMKLVCCCCLNSKSLSQP